MKQWMLVFAALCAAVPAVHAQSRVTADIPFAFRVGGEECPAGIWTIRQSGSNSTILMLESRDGKHRFLAATGPARKHDLFGPAQLVFHQYGAERFLSQVLWSGGAGSQFQTGAAERRLIAEHGPAVRVALTFAGSK